MKPLLSRLLVPSIVIALAPLALCAPLQQASINQIVNDVKVIDPAKGARTAAVKDVIRDDLAVRTGIQSRTELLFQDNTLTRLGAETLFSFKAGTRDLNLDHGTMLLQVPKGQGGARIRTASVTASITGTTIMLEYLPEKSLKVVVLEGSLRLSANGRLGEAINLTAGRMIIMDPKSKRIPEPVKVDLRKLVNTSLLVNPVAFKGNSKAKPAVLPSMPLIEKEIAQQDRLVKGRDLVGTNLVIAGSGTEVVLASEEKLAQLDKGILFDKGTVSTAGGQIEAPIPTRLPAAAEAALDPVKIAAVPKDSTETTSTDSVATTGKSKPALTLTTPITAAAIDPSATVVTTDPAASVAAAGAAAAPSAFVAASAPDITAPVSTGGNTANPSVIGSSQYVVTNNTDVLTAVPSITSGGVTEQGGIYQSVAASGSASTFLFGSASSFDNTSGLDASFGAAAGGTVPAKGVAVYRFADLHFQQAPTYNTANGPTDVAFVSQAGLTSSPSGGAWQLDSLRSLFLGSANGPIVLSNEFGTKSLLLAFRYLQVYARGGSGSITLDGRISLPLSGLYVNAEQNITVTNNASITALGATFASPGRIVFETSPTAGMLTVNSGTRVELQQPLSNGVVNITSPSLLTQNLSALGGTLNIGAGGIEGGGNAITGFDQINVAGYVEARALSARNGINIGGTMSSPKPNSTVDLTATTIAIGGGLDLSARVNGNGGVVNVHARDVDISSTGINGIRADGSDGLLALVGGGNGGDVNLGTKAKPITNSINVSRPISATTGANGTGVLTGGNGGTVNLVASGPITVNSQIKVSDSAVTRASSRGGSINLESRKTSGAAITVNNSGELLSLLNSAAVGRGGAITFVSAGGDILVDGATAQADRGTVDLRNNGAGNVSLMNANLRGDVVKVGALGRNGQLLVGGGSINADTTLKLYGGTSNGSVRFTDDVTLGGASTKTIAGKTVTIDNGKTVTVGGITSANVFTDRPNYTGSGGNGSTTGSFAGRGANTKAFNKAPNF